MLRMICLVGGLACGAGLSQYPAFSQQYLQRLAGQVDALTVVARDFDASALAAGLGREEALQQMTGTAFLEARQADMRRTFARHARLADNLMTLRAAGPFERMTLPHRMADADILRATWSDFSPAMPLSLAGVTAAGTGFAGGWLLLAGGLAMLAAPFRRRQRPAKPKPRQRLRDDPPLARPVQPVVSGPRLAGVQRSAR